jgi:hypothetical protein
MVVAFEAMLTSLTRDGWVARHTLTGAPAAGNRADELMSEDQGLSKNCVPDAAFDEPVPVRAAQPDSGHA